METEVWDMGLETKAGTIRLGPKKTQQDKTPAIAGAGLQFHIENIMVKRDKMIVRYHIS